MLMNVMFIEKDNLALNTETKFLKVRSTVARICHKKFYSFISIVQNFFPNLSFRKQQNYK